jgi:hypothetical protein
LARLAEATRGEGLLEGAGHLLGLKPEAGPDLLGAEAAWALLEESDDRLDDPADVAGRTASEPAAPAEGSRSTDGGPSGERARGKPRRSFADERRGPPASLAGLREELVERDAAYGLEHAGGEGRGQIVETVAKRCSHGARR